jgi:hypothetical protein
LPDAFPHGLIFALYDLEKRGCVSSYLVPEPQAEISGFLEQRLFRIEEMGRQALREPALPEQSAELTANPFAEWIASMKQRQSTPPDKLAVQFAAAIAFWKEFGPWLPQPLLSK